MAGIGRSLHVPASRFVFLSSSFEQTDPRLLLLGLKSRTYNPVASSIAPVFTFENNAILYFGGAGSPQLLEPRMMQSKNHYLWHLNAPSQSQTSQVLAGPRPLFWIEQNLKVGDLTQRGYLYCTQAFTLKKADPKWTPIDTSFSGWSSAAFKFTMTSSFWVPLVLSHPLFTKQRRTDWVTLFLKESILSYHVLVV